MENDRRGVADLHIDNSALFNSLARRGKHNVFFAVGIAAVARTVAAVVCGYNKERVLDNAFFLVGFINFSDISVDLRDLCKMCRRIISAGVTRSVNLIKLNENKLWCFFGNEFANLVANGSIVNTAVFVNVQAVFDNTDIYGVPV